MLKLLTHKKEGRQPCPLKDVVSSVALNNVFKRAGKTYTETEYKEKQTHENQFISYKVRGKTYIWTASFTSRTYLEGFADIKISFLVLPLNEFYD